MKLLSLDPVWLGYGYMYEVELPNGERVLM